MARGFSNLDWKLFRNFSSYLSYDGARRATFPFNHVEDTEQHISLPPGIPTTDDNLANFKLLLNTMCYTLDNLFLWKDDIRRAVRDLLARWIDFLEVHYPGPTDEPGTQLLFQLVGSQLLADLNEIYMACYSLMVNEDMVLQTINSLPYLTNPEFQRQLLWVNTASFAAHIGGRKVGNHTTTSAKRGGKRGGGNVNSSATTADISTVSKSGKAKVSNKDDSCFFHLSPDGCKFSADKCYRVHRAVVKESEREKLANFLAQQKDEQVPEVLPASRLTASKGPAGATSKKK
jgi:hypothetical protein